MKNSLLLAGATYGLTVDDNFTVVRCNNELTNEPELTFSIKQSYFNDHLSFLLDQERFVIARIKNTISKTGIIASNMLDHL